MFQQITVCENRSPGAPWRAWRTSRARMTSFLNPSTPGYKTKRVVSTHNVTGFTVVRDDRSKSNNDTTACSNAINGGFSQEVHTHKVAVEPPECHKKHVIFFVAQRKDVSLLEGRTDELHWICRPIKKKTPGHGIPRAPGVAHQPTSPGNPHLLA